MVNNGKNREKIYQKIPNVNFSIPTPYFAKLWENARYPPPPISNFCKLFEWEAKNAEMAKKIVSIVSKKGGIISKTVGKLK